MKSGKRLLTLGSIGLVLLGALMFAGAKAAVDHTNSLGFCISCHEMKDNNYEEYKSTVHARNRTGVVATCADCHVPHGFVDTAIRKIGAANDVFHHLLGTIDSKEKFEAHRADLARRVWDGMRANDSRECRHCHDAAAMDSEAQGPTARKQHRKLATGERTCIDCHYGIAHKEPGGGLEPRGDGGG